MASFTAISTGSDMQNKTYYQEIENALYERWTVSGASSKPAWAVSGGDTAAGDDIQDATFWSARQNAMSTLITTATYPFLRVGAAGSVPTDLSSLENASSIPEFTAASQLWALVCGSTSGPRRCTTTPGSYTYGTCQAGDIIGPWLIEDLQLALQYLSWTVVDSLTSGTWYLRRMYYQLAGSWYDYVDSTRGASYPWSNSVALYDGNATTEYPTINGQYCASRDDSGYTPGDPGLQSSACAWASFYYRATGTDVVSAYLHRKSMAISPSLSTLLEKKYSLICRTDDIQIGFPTYLYHAWQHSGVSNGNYAVLGESISWQTTNQTIDVRAMLSATWDTGFTAPGPTDDKDGGGQYYAPHVAVLWNWSHS